MYCKVLIIDDEYIMRQGIRHMIEWEKEGFLLAAEAADGEEGLDLMEKYRPDIVLVDIVMPVLDGIEFSMIAKKRYPHIKLIILSSYDKFEYVKAALLNGACDYILKPSLDPETLLRVLENAAAQIPGMRLEKNSVKLSVCEKLCRMLNGYQADLTQGDFQQRFPYTKYRLLLSKNSAGRHEDSVHLQYFMQEYWKKAEDYAWAVLSAGTDTCVVLLNYRIKDEMELSALVNQCARRAVRCCPDSFFVYGDTFEGLPELISAYRKCCVLTEQKFYQKNSPLFCCSGNKEGRPAVRFAYEHYAEFLKYRDFQAAFRLIKDYALQMCSSRVEEYMLKNTVKTLLYNFMVEKEKADGAMEVNKSDLFRRIDRGRNVEEFQRELAQVFEEMGRECRNGISAEGSLLQIQQYMKEHYAENLELAKVAKQFNYNYNYLSTCFNRKMKESFSEYLNRIRIEKACEFLRESAYPIAQVSSMVGYSDPSYFSKIFKMQTGRTPSQWKRRNEKKDE